MNRMSEKHLAGFTVGEERKWNIMVRKSHFLLGLAFSRYRSVPDIKMPPEEPEPKAGDERLPFYLHL